jgi:hypothetical protein
MAREKLRAGYRELHWTHPRVMDSPIDHEALSQRAYKWVGEHRVVMAYELNRSLHAGEHVHHIDGNKLNNTPQNLEVLPSRKHSELHADIWQELQAAREELSFWRAMGEHLDRARALAEKHGRFSKRGGLLPLVPG